MIKVRLPTHKKLQAAKARRSSRPARSIETTVGRVIFNDILHAEDAVLQPAAGPASSCSRIIADCYQLLGRRETIDLLDDMKELGFRESTRSGPVVRHRRPEDAGDQGADHRARPRRRSTKISKLYQRGIITEQERYNKVLDAWTHAREQITNEMMERAQERRPRRRRSTSTRSS